MAAYRPVMTHVTCSLTAKNRDQLRNPTLGNRVWATFTFIVGVEEQVSGGQMSSLCVGGRAECVADPAGYTGRSMPAFDSTRLDWA